MGSMSRDIFALNYASSSSSSANANNQSDHHPGLFTPVSVTSGNVSSIGSVTCPNCGACFQPRNPPHGSSTLPPSAQSSFASFSSDQSSTLFSNPDSLIGLFNGLDLDQFGAGFSAHSRKILKVKRKTRRR